MLRVEGDAGAAVRARVRVGWNEFGQLVPLLTIGGVSLMVGGRCVWTRYVQQLIIDLLFHFWCHSSCYCHALILCSFLLTCVLVCARMRACVCQWVCVCVCVCTLKVKWLELSTPNLVDVPCMAFGQHVKVRCHTITKALLVWVCMSLGLFRFSSCHYIACRWLMALLTWQLWMLTLQLSWKYQELVTSNCYIRYRQKISLVGSYHMSSSHKVSLAST